MNGSILLAQIPVKKQKGKRTEQTTRISLSKLAQILSDKSVGFVHQLPILVVLIKFESSFKAMIVKFTHNFNKDEVLRHAQHGLFVVPRGLCA